MLWKPNIRNGVLAPQTTFFSVLVQSNKIFSEAGGLFESGALDTCLSCLEANTTLNVQPVIKELYKSHSILLSHVCMTNTK